MTQEHLFETPEDVDLGFELAGPPARFAAYIIDRLWLFLIQLLVIIVSVFVIFSVGEMQSNWSADLSEGWGMAMLIILWGFSEFLYFGYFEWRRNGSTPGKKKTGLRTVMAGGYRLNPTAAWLRNLLRPVDVIPLCWLVPLVDKQHRRLGDFLAGTIVIREARASAPELPLSHISYAELTPRLLNLGRTELLQLRRRDYQVLEEYLVRRLSVARSQRQRLEKLLLVPLLERVQIEMPLGASTELVLTELYLALRDSPGLLDQLDD
jgi:uncharacterized RDD family membrane protein YckC